MKLTTNESIKRHLISYLIKYDDAQCSADSHLNTALYLAMEELEEDRLKELLEESTEAECVLLLEKSHIAIRNPSLLEKDFVKKAIENAKNRLS